jgi:uncharacterized repeat protein (TIGR03803 family)
VKSNLIKIVPILAAFCVGMVAGSQAQTLTTLLTFDGQGAQPGGALAQGLDGEFYGTTQYGGIDFDGTVFRMTPAGQLVRFSFCAVPNCDAGAFPYEGNLTLGRDGNLYGTAEAGGVHTAGTVFRLTPSGALTALYSFCADGECLDGDEPLGGVVQDSNGDFYGTTVLYGVNNAGVIFSLTEAGVETTLHTFCSDALCADGKFPTGGLIQATDGNLYGTTSGGGEYGVGTVFKMTARGKLTRLYSFCAQPQPNCSDGKEPSGRLIQASDGNFYGTTAMGGAFGWGTIFKITPEGVLTTLYSFCAQTSCTDGAGPFTGLIQATDENFYGTTPWGGNGLASGCIYFCGTVFEMTPAGKLTTLYNFCSQANCADGNVPLAALIQATDGNLYGTTSMGGDLNCPFPRFAGCGTVFTLKTGLAPFVQPNPTAGKAGYEIKILGNNLTGTTSVTFNGTPAMFTVASDTYIKATVPTGAMTGMIQVTTPSGTLDSSVAFRVLP